MGAVEEIVHRRPTEQGGDPQLVPAGEEDSSRLLDRLQALWRARFFPLRHPDDPNLASSEVAEELAVLPPDFLWLLGRDGHHHDPRARAAAQAHELLQDRAVAFLVLVTADDDERSRSPG